MNFSEREQQILRFLLKHPQGLKMATLEQGLDVSRRTIYREFTTLNKTLKSKKLFIDNQHAHYQLVGSATALDALQAELQQSSQKNLVLSIKQRQQAITLILLKQTEQIKMQSLAIELHTSVATIAKDLDSLAEVFSDYQLNLSRQKARGIQLEGLEFARRNLTIAILDNEINPFEFFETLQNPQSFQENNSFSQYLMKLASFPLLQQSYQILQDNPATELQALSDENYKRLIITLAIVIDSLETNREITEIPGFQVNQITKERPLALALFLKLPSAFKSQITTPEVNYLSWEIHGLLEASLSKQTLKGYDLQASYLIKRFINQVSADFGWDFSLDRDLYNNLTLLLDPHSNLTSVEPIHEAQLPELPDLDELVIKSLTSFYRNRNFTENELNAVQVLFENSLKIIMANQSLHVLVICPNGISSAQILKSRLLKKINAIYKVSIARVSQLSSLDFSEYDLIISTIDLPNFSYEYQVVSPLLLDDEVAQLQTLIKLKFLQTRPQTPTPPNNQPLQDFQTFYLQVEKAKSLLDNFQIIQLTQQTTDLQEIMQEIIKPLVPQVVSDADYVAHKLIQRHHDHAVGIPETNLALIHTTSRKINQPYVAIYQLATPITFQAMGATEIQLSRIVLLLGPKDMTAFENILMSAISPLILSNATLTNLFEHGNVASLKQSIGNEFIQIINNESR